MFEETQFLTQEQRDVRNIARGLGIPHDDAEKMKSKFDMFDTDKSGLIDKGLFFLYTYNGILLVLYYM